MNLNPGRNDPCPCGSGKKYKKCCLGKTTSPVEPAVATTAELRFHPVAGMERPAGGE